MRLSLLLKLRLSLFLALFFITNCKSSSSNSDSPKLPVDNCPNVTVQTECNNNTACSWNPTASRCVQKPNCIGTDTTSCSAVNGCQWDASTNRCFNSFTQVVSCSAQSTQQTCLQYPSTCKWAIEVTPNRCYDINAVVTVPCAGRPQATCNQSSGANCQFNTATQQCMDASTTGTTGTFTFAMCPTLTDQTMCNSKKPYCYWLGSCRSIDDYCKVITTQQTCTSMPNTLICQWLSNRCTAKDPSQITLPF